MFVLEIENVLACGVLRVDGNVFGGFRYAWSPGVVKFAQVAVWTPRAHTPIACTFA